MVLSYMLVGSKPKCWIGFSDAQWVRLLVRLTDCTVRQARRMECFCFSPSDSNKRIRGNWRGLFFLMLCTPSQAFRLGRGRGQLAVPHIAPSCARRSEHVNWTAAANISRLADRRHWAGRRAEAVNRPAAPRHNWNEICWPLTSVVFAVLYQCFHSGLDDRLASSVAARKLYIDGWHEVLLKNVQYVWIWKWHQTGNI